MAEAGKEAMLWWNEVAKARKDAATVKEAARATEDAATTATDDVQDVGLQAGFKILC